MTRNGGAAGARCKSAGGSHPAWLYAKQRAAAARPDKDAQPPRFIWAPCVGATLLGRSLAGLTAANDRPSRRTRGGWASGGLGHHQGLPAAGTADALASHARGDRQDHPADQIRTAYLDRSTHRRGSYHVALLISTPDQRDLSTKNPWRAKGIADFRFPIFDLTTMASRLIKGGTIGQAPDKTSPQRQQGSMSPGESLAPDARIRWEPRRSRRHSPLNVSLSSPLRAEEAVAQMHIPTPSEREAWMIWPATSTLADAAG